MEETRFTAKNGNVFEYEDLMTDKYVWITTNSDEEFCTPLSDIIEFANFVSKQLIDRKIAMLTKQVEHLSDSHSQSRSNMHICKDLVAHKEDLMDLERLRENE